MIRRLVLLVLATVPLACSTGTGTSHGPDGGVPCSSPSDCPSTYTCRQGLCEPNNTGGGCSKNGCPAHAFCDTDDTCKTSGQKACTSDSDCGGKFTCNLAIGLCIEPCVVDTDCASGQTCNAAVGGCSECTFDPDCTADPAKPYCLSTSGVCVACTTSGQCAAGTYCDLTPGDTKLNQCLSGCLTGSDCAVGSRCDRPGTDPGTCVECTSATQSTDCTDPTKPVCDDTTHTCVQCVSDGDCGTMVCSPAQTCVQCLDDTLCNLGQVCDTTGDATNYTCVDGCDANARCPPPASPNLSLCDTARGTYGQCVQCLSQSDCGAGFKCDSTGTCVPGCDSSATCPTAKPICDLLANGGQGQCVECRSDSDCRASNLHCDTTPASPTYETCQCLVQGDACTATNQCGNGMPPHNGTCQGLNACISQVRCTSGTTQTWRTISLVCGEACSDPAGGSGCASGFTCRITKDETGANQLARCTPSNACN